MGNENKAKLNKILLYVAFIMYIFILIWLIGLKFNSEWLPEIGEYFRKLPLKDRITKGGLIPFYNMISEFKKGDFYQLDYYMNIVVYIPLGIYLLIFLENKHKYLLSFLIIIFSSILFELIQLFTGFGGCDGTDFGCNVLGGTVGLLISRFLLKKNAIKLINIINIAVVIIFLPLVIYAFINTIMNLHLYRI